MSSKVRCFLVASVLVAGAVVGGCSDRVADPEEDAGSGDAGLERMDAAPADGGPRDGGARDGGGKDRDGGVPDDGGKMPPGDAGAGDGGGGALDGGHDGGLLDAGADARSATGCPDQDLGSALGVDLATGSTVSAGDDVTPGCSFSSGAPDVTFTWTAPAAGTYTIDTNGSTFDTILQVRDGCGGPSLGCDDDGGAGTESLVRVTLAAGAVIAIELDGYDSDSGDYHLSITEAPSSESDCSNGVDDDRDGDVDCEDYDCDALPACHESNCADGVDDDGDGDTDCFDYDCSTDPACIETSCHDSIDDDGDGDTDCDDFDCYEQCHELVCDDGLDDDSDGLADCSDDECACDPACVVSSCPDQDLGSALGDAIASGTIPPGSCSEQSGASCGSGGAGPDVTFRWTAPSAGTYRFTTYDGSGSLSTYDTMLYVLDGSCAGPELACNDDSAGGVQSEVTVTLSAGQTVIIVLDAYYEGDSGDYVLNASMP